MKIVSGILAILVSVGLLGTIGWLPSQDTTDVPARQCSPLAGLDLVHSVGSLSEGSRVEHIFTVKNDLQIPISIVDDADVQKTCGCATLDPSARRVPPGCTANVRMRVDTSGKHGRFRVGGLIRWRTDNGEPWPVNLYIEGTATTILASKPGLIRFPACDATEQSTKELLVFNSQDVDWSTLNVQIDPPYAALVEKSIYSDHLRLLLRPCPPTDLSDFSATLRLSADLQDAQGDIKRCALAVPVQGSQRVRLHVSPRVVFGNWSQELRKGTARFLVRGIPSAGSESISSISCDGFRASWAATDVSTLDATAHHTLQVELSLFDPHDPAFDPKQARRVRIALAGGHSLEVSIYFVAQQERS